MRGRAGGSRDGSSRVESFAFLAVALLGTAPAWIVPHPPLQDLPLHLATLRQIHDYANPTFGFETVYETALLRTQYLLFYLAGHVLAFVIGVKAAGVAVISLYLAGLPLAMRVLLRALGRDPRLAWFSAPLAANVMFGFGLLPFVCGFPLMLLTMAAAARHVERPGWGRGITLALLLWLTFLTHVLPFAIAGLGCLALFPWREPRRWLVAAAPPATGLLLVVWWVLASPAGEGTLAHLRAQEPFAPWREALVQVPQWSTDLFRDRSDEWWTGALAATAAAALVLVLAERGAGSGAAVRYRAFAVVPLVCVVAYFSLGNMLGDVWMFGQRFAVPALLCSIPLLRLPAGRRGTAVTVVAAAIATLATVNVCRHFVRFESEEAVGLEEVLAAMAPRARVAGLIYDKRSAVMAEPYAPFLHFVSYYQLEKGGVVQFSYSGFPHWPVQYRAGMLPPPGRMPRLRWEWTPEQVPIGELFPYYDYVLTRGSGFRPPPGTFRIKARSGRFTVWQREQ